jgi:hypothetical protein
VPGATDQIIRDIRPRLASWLRPGVGRCTQPDSPYVVRAVAPNAHADAHQGNAISLRTILINAPFFSQLIIFRIILWRIRVGEGDEQDEREQRCCAVGNRVQGSDLIHGCPAGLSATGCLSICLSTVPQDAV